MCTPHTDTHNILHTSTREYVCTKTSTAIPSLNTSSSRFCTLGRVHLSDLVSPKKHTAARGLCASKPEPLLLRPPSPAVPPLLVSTPCRRTSIVRAAASATSSRKTVLSHPGCRGRGRPDSSEGRRGSFSAEGWRAPEGIIVVVFPQQVVSRVWSNSTLVQVAPTARTDEIYEISGAYPFEGKREPTFAGWGSQFFRQKKKYRRSSSSDLVMSKDDDFVQRLSKRDSKNSSKRDQTREDLSLRFSSAHPAPFKPRVSLERRSQVSVQVLQVFVVCQVLRSCAVTTRLQSISPSLSASCMHLFM